MKTPSFLTGSRGSIIAWAAVVASNQNVSTICIAHIFIGDVIDAANPSREKRTITVGGVT